MPDCKFETLGKIVFRLWPYQSNIHFSGYVDNSFATFGFHIASAYQIVGYYRPANF